MLKYLFCYIQIHALKSIANCCRSVHEEIEIVKLITCLDQQLSLTMDIEYVDIV